MKDIIYIAVVGLASVLGFCLRLMAVVGKRAFMLAMPVAEGAARRWSEKRRATRERREQVAAAAVQLQSGASSLQADTAAVPVAADFEVADRIVSIRLDPPVGVINLRVYNASGVVKRDLIINEPRLRTLMRGRRHTLADVQFDPVAGLEDIKDETIEAVETLINRLGNKAVRATRPPKDDFERSKAPQAASAASEAPAAQEVSAAPEAAPEVVPVQVPSKACAPVGSVVAPKVSTGYTYVGELAKARTETQRPKGRAPYEVFEVTLRLDNGAELALRGAELERELTANGCKVGERIGITPMGKVPVTLASGGEGSKNLYRVQRYGAQM